MGVKRAIGNSIANTSITKTAPAIGVLKAADTPAAVPQIVITFNLSPVSLNNCPIVLAIEAATWIIGVSRPAEPPEEIVIAVLSDFVTTVRGNIFPPLNIKDFKIQWKLKPRDSVKK